MTLPPSADLPYTDTKPEGAADFYFAINATFRFLLGRLGAAGWQRYLEEMGRSYFAPVNQRWRQGGLPVIAGYWRAFFAAEPGARVDVVEHPDRVEVCVHECPAIKHLRAGKREIVPTYCQHCYHLGNAALPRRDSQCDWQAETEPAGTRFLRAWRERPRRNSRR